MNIFDQLPVSSSVCERQCSQISAPSRGAVSIDRGTERADRVGRGTRRHGVLRINLAYSTTIGINHITKQSIIPRGRPRRFRLSQMVRCNRTEPPAKRELQPLERD
jgi:hypothetical protein